MKKRKIKIAFLVFIVAVLMLAYFLGGNVPPQKEDSAVSILQEVTQDTGKNDDAELCAEESKEKDEVIISNEVKEEKLTKEELCEETEQKDLEYSSQQGMDINRETGTDMYNTQPVPQGMPVPIEPQTVTISDKELTCTLSVRCDTLLNNIEWLDAEKVELVPKDGVIFAEREVMFYEGESVFNLLLREMKRNKIHMEYSNTPIYNSVYIEGINNLYEFDCGELSGWMYKVNGWFPNYGCSRYQLKQGDRVEWVYTCDLGKDVGENSGF